MKQKCRKCDAEMYMLKHVETSKVNPIYAIPQENGNISIDLERGTYRILSKDAQAVFKESGGDLYVSHFSNCGFAKSFRR